MKESDIEEAIERMGHTLRRMSKAGCWPAGYKSNWPETLRDLGLIEMLDLKTEVRKSPPSKDAITELDYMMILIASADITPEDRKIIYMRAGCVPGKRRAWKVIEAEFRQHRVTLWKKWRAALAQLAKDARKSKQHFSMQQNSGLAA
jgi:hypothetical protein